MSVHIPSGYADRHVDHHALVTFYLRESLKQRMNAKAAFDQAVVRPAVSLHVYNSRTHGHWHAVGHEGQNTEGALSDDNIVHLKDVLNRCGEGSMVVVARNGDGTPNCHAREEQLARALRQEGLIQSAEQFLVVKPAAETALKSGPLVSRLQLA